MNNNEYILCAAIWFNDDIEHIHQPKNINTGFVITGRRHHNCIAILEIMNKRTADFVIDGKRKYVQGFLTSKDRFVDRKEGGEIAYNAGQTKELEKTLFSEDLY